MNDAPTSAEDEAQAAVKLLKQQIARVREILGESEGPLPLLYTGSDVALEGARLLVPLSRNGVKAYLAMSPYVATDLVEHIGSVLGSRRSAAARKVRGLHVPETPDDEDTYCKHDGESWPCSTIVALRGEGPE